MRLLDSKESWNLFYKKVFEEESFYHEFETTGREIVKRCQGLPLTIVLVAGLLTTANKSPDQWQKVAESVNTGIVNIDLDEQCLKVVALSYNYLPCHLKPCFLYFGVFPEDSELPVESLIKLWIAEGFLKLDISKSLEDVAESYLQNLTDRSVVQVTKWNCDGKMKVCRVHDLVHEFCLREAQRENLLLDSNRVHARAGVFKTQRAYRWTSYQLIQASHNNDGCDKFRSFLYFSRGEYRIKYFTQASCCFQLLRVLDLNSGGLFFHTSPLEIAPLVHLRYLALPCLEFLDGFQLFKLQNLQTFIVSRLYDLTGMPCNILDLPRPRHVHVSRGFVFNLPNKVRENLQTISWLYLGPWSTTSTPDFTRIPNVKKMAIRIETQPGYLSSVCVDTIFYLYRLEELKIKIDNISFVNWDKFRLPDAFSPNLKKLTLIQTNLPWEDMVVIGNLPNLKILKLKGDSFSGQEWEPAEEGFLQLKMLLIQAVYLEFWKATSDHFPVLERLVLRECKKLKEIPIGFADIYTLQSIKLSTCSTSLVNSAKLIQEEQQSFGNKPILLHEFNTKD